MNHQPEPGQATLKVRTEPVQQRGARRIQLLLDVAAELIDEKGIDALTTSDVAVRSGSSVGVVYRYFPNIQSLLRSLAARNMEKFGQQVFSSLDPDPRGWLATIDSTIDAYVDLMRTEPGFRQLCFGDVIDKRFIEPEISNNAVLVRGFSDMLERKYGVVPSDALSFDLEVIVEIADALIDRAFMYSKDGDMRFIERLRALAHRTLDRHESLAATA